MAPTESTVGLTLLGTSGTVLMPMLGTIVPTRQPVKHVRPEQQEQMVISSPWPMLKWILLMEVNFQIHIQGKVVSVIMQLRFLELADLVVLLIQRHDSNFSPWKLNIKNDSGNFSSIWEFLEISLNPTKGWNTLQDLCLWYFIQANNLSDNKFDNIKIWNRLVLCRMRNLGRRQRYPKIQWNNYG